MKDVCVECGAMDDEGNPLKHADWCQSLHRPAPEVGVKADSTMSLEDRVTALERTLDSMVDERLQHYATSMADRLKAIEDRAVKLSDYAKGRLDLDSAALESHERRIETAEAVLNGVCDRLDRVYVGPNPRLDDFEKRLDAIEKVWRSLDQRLAKLEWKSTLHEGKSVVVGHIDMATGKVEPTEAGNALMADSAGKVRLTPNQYLYGVLWRRGDFDHAEMRKEVLEAIGGKGSKAQHDAIEWACSVMEPPDDFDVWTLDEAANVGPPPATQAAVDDYNAKLYAGLGSWREGNKIHTPDCAMSQTAGEAPCDCWHSKAGVGADGEPNTAMKDVIADHIRFVGGLTQSADGRIETSGESRLRPANHIEDTLVSKVTAQEAVAMGNGSEYYELGAPKKAKRKRKWWRLGL